MDKDIKITICSKVPDVVPHKVIHHVKSFLVDPDGVIIVRYIITSGTLVSDYFKFGSVFVGVSYDECSQM